MIAAETILDVTAAALATVFTALLVAAASLMAKRTRQVGERLRVDLEDRVGTPNGHGNVVQMLQSVLRMMQQVLAEQTEQAARLVRIEERQGRLVEGHREHGSRIGELEKCMAVLRTELTAREAP